MSFSEVKYLCRSDLPVALQEVQPPIEGIYFKGNCDLIHQPSLAIVGSRRPSQYGLRAALHFSQKLTDSGWIIVSGLARGIDSTAHLGCLRRQGKTIAVLGHGLDRIYPSENWSLAQNIVDTGGCLISEYPPQMPPLPHHFPARNRILSALAVGTLVIEAGEKSGSLITAQCTLDQGKELFVVPSVFDEQRFRGSHRLLKTGAKLVSCVEDVTEEFDLIPCAPLPESDPGFRSVLQKIFSERKEAVTLEELISSSGQSVGDLLMLIEKGMESGEIAEIYPKCFSWVGHQEQDEMEAGKNEFFFQ